MLASKLTAMDCKLVDQLANAKFKSLHHRSKQLLIRKEVFFDLWLSELEFYICNWSINFPSTVGGLGGYVLS